jgi:amino acid transporter
MTRPAAGADLSGGPARLRRVLSLWDLIFYGVVAVTPSAPATVFGLAEVRSHGHVVLTILVAMVAMVLTAISYGRMAALYPSAGSAYTYVSHGIHPYAGFVAGWAMLLDYLLIPLFCVIYGSLALERAFPAMPYLVCTLFFAGGITYLNIRGIRSTARANQVLLLLMFSVLGWFIVAAVRAIVFRDGIGGLFVPTAIINPSTFNFRAVASATSFAALTYLGFDAVTTLAEDVANPRRSVILAAVSVCAFTGIFGGLLVYLGHLVWPDYQTYKNIETAFIDVTGKAGGPALLEATAVMLILANIGAGLTSQVGAARLLLGMGRDRVVPEKVFARLHPVRNTPDAGILITGILALIGAQFMSYELTAELLNFGAFLGFMGVNAAVVWKFWFRNGPQERKFLLDLLTPAAGFVFCAIIWVGLSTPAKIAGSAWLCIGLVVVGMRTRGFREPMALTSLAGLE